MIRILKDHENRPIRLTDERLAHILEHPEMVDFEAAIAETLREPQLVIRSASDTNATLSYRFYHRTIVGGKWLCVVVKWNMDDGFILTAYLTDKPKSGEQLWPSM